MAKSVDCSSKQFYIYKHAVCVFGKEILLKHLKWLYKGGERNYIEYLLTEYDLQSMGILVAEPSKNNLGHKTPEEFDVNLIHILLQLTCHLYEDEEDDELSPARLIEEKINILVLEVVTVQRNELKLVEDEITDRLNDLRRFYTEMISITCMCRFTDAKDCSKLGMEIYFGMENLIQMSEGIKNTPQRYSISCPVRGIPHMEEKLLDAFNRKLDYEEVSRCISKYKDVTVSCDSVSRCKMPNFPYIIGRSKVKDFHDNQEKVREIGRLDNQIELLSLMLNDDVDNSILKVFRKTVVENLRMSIESDGSPCISGLMARSEGSIKGVKGSSTKVLEVRKSLGSFIRADKLASAKNSTCDNSIGGKSATSQRKVENGTLQSRPSFKEERLVLNKLHSKDSLDVETLQSRICTALCPKFSNGLKHIDFSILPSLCQHQKYSRRPGCRLEIEDLRNLDAMNDGIAEIILLSGDAGMGKTMAMKYITESWRDFGRKHNANMSKNNSIWCQDLIFPCDLQGNCFSTFTQLISSLLTDEVGDFDIAEDRLKDKVLELSVLVVLDGYDESCQKSCQLVKEVTQMTGKDLRVIVTCRPQYVDFIYKQIPKLKRKRVCHVGLNKISPSDHANFVGKLMLKNESSGEDAVHLKKISNGLINRLPDIYKIIGEELCNPLMLEIITAMWIEHPIVELPANNNYKHCIA